MSQSSQNDIQAPAPEKSKQQPNIKQPAQTVPSPQQELQKAIEDAANDRAALVRNLQAYLRKYPEAQQRPQIYRALVEACLQVRDNTCAMDYAERIVALTPEDISITMLAIQLLERSGDAAGLRRATNYASRVFDTIERRSSADKSPRESAAEWEVQKKTDLMSILLIRGRLEMKLQDTAAATKDFEASYARLPNSGAAEKLGELAELNKDLNHAITEYARAFALADTSAGSSHRRETRQKLGNVWRQAHGSEDGLGDFMLRTYDEITQVTTGAARKNASAKEIYEFTLRKFPEGAPYPLSHSKGSVLVLNFWATWCGPCRALEPHFERVAAQFADRSDVLFLAANCDEDETLVPPYLQEEKLKTPVVFSDGLENFLAVNSYPTLIVLDRAGKIAYRSDGFDPDNVEKELSEAVRRNLPARTARQ